MSPWWIRNAIVLGAFVPFTTNRRENLYLGNNPHNLDGGVDWTDDADPQPSQTQLSRIPDELASGSARSTSIGDRLYQRKSERIPPPVAAKKFVRFWNVVPNAAEITKRRFMSIVSAASFGPILLLALACALRWWRRWRLFAPIYLMIGYFTLVAHGRHRVDCAIGCRSSRF